MLSSASDSFCLDCSWLVSETEDPNLRGVWCSQCTTPNPKEWIIDEKNVTSDDPQQFRQCHEEANVPLSNQHLEHDSNSRAPPNHAVSVSNNRSDENPVVSPQVRQNLENRIPRKDDSLSAPADPVSRPRSTESSGFRVEIRCSSRMARALQQPVVEDSAENNLRRRRMQQLSQYNGDGRVPVGIRYRRIARNQQHIRRMEAALEMEIEATWNWALGPRAPQGPIFYVRKTKLIHSKKQLRFDQAAGSGSGSQASANPEVVAPPLSLERIGEQQRIQFTTRALRMEISCMVCFENFVDCNEGMRLDCGHIFHQVCILKWFRIKGECAMCRKRLVGDEDRSRGRD